MGVIIDVLKLNTDLIKRSTSPIILCTFPKRVARLIEINQFSPLNMNIKLAEELMKYPVAQRSYRANDEVMSIISKCEMPMLLEDYEILFDPRYDIDTIKVFIELSRRQKVVVKWSGRLSGNSLEYATPDDKDYHSFRIQDYDIICVI